MHGIKHQSSVEAAALIRNAMKYEDLEVLVSKSGNVRLAYGPERFFLGIVNAIDSSAREKRIDRAKNAVVNKLSAELETIGIQISTVKIPVIKKMALAMTEKSGESDSPADTTVSVIEGRIEKFIEDIRNVSKQAKDKTLKYFWQAIEHDRRAGCKPDVSRALSIAHTTMKWAQELKVNESSAFNTALNAHQLLNKKNIPLEEGKEILLMAGRLSTCHQFSENEALDFAIEKFSVLKGLHIRMDSIERVIKSIDDLIPEFRTTPQATRISVAIRYFQLLPKAPGAANLINEIRKILADHALNQSMVRTEGVIKKIQRSVPTGMRISTTPGTVNRYTLDVDQSKVTSDLKDRVRENIKPEHRVASANEQIARAREKSFSKNVPIPPDETEMAFADLNTNAMEDWGRASWIFQTMEPSLNEKDSAATETLENKPAAEVARKFRGFCRDLGYDGLQLLAAGLVQTAYGDIFVQARSRHRTASGGEVMLALDRKRLESKLGNIPTKNDSTTIQLTRLPDANIEVKIVSLQRSNTLIDSVTGEQISIDSDFQSWNEPISEANATSITTLKYTLDAESLRKRAWVLIGEPEASQILQIPTPIV